MNIDDILWKDDKKAVLTDAMEVIDKIECLVLMWREDDGKIYIRASAWTSEMIGLAELLKHMVIDDKLQEFRNEQDG